MAANNGVLLVAEEWWPKSACLTTSIVNREIAIQLTKLGHKVFNMVLAASDEEQADATKNGVFLMLPVDRELEIPLHAKLILHKFCFPSLKNINTISMVIGHADDSGTADAALCIQQQIFPDAKFVPIYYRIPRRMKLDPFELRAMENEMMEYAEASHGIVSVGKDVHDYYKGKSELKKSNLIYIPWVGEEFLDFEVTSSNTEDKMEILTVQRVDSNNSDDIDAAAKAIMKVITYYEYDSVKPRWKLRGIPTDGTIQDVRCQKTLLELEKRNALQLEPFPSSMEEIKRELQQCQLLVLFSSKEDPFGIIGLIACAAGVPTLMTESLGLANVIKENVSLTAKHSLPICNVENVDSVGSERWKESIMPLLKQYDMATERAQEIKRCLHESAQNGAIAKCHKELIGWVSSCVRSVPSQGENEEQANIQGSSSKFNVSQNGNGSGFLAETNVHLSQSDYGNSDTNKEKGNGAIRRSQEADKRSRHHEGTPVVKIRVPCDSLSHTKLAVIEISKIVYAEQTKRDGVLKLLGGHHIEELDSEHDDEMVVLLEIRDEARMLKVLKERPGTLMPFGISRALVLTKQQLSSVRNKSDSGYKYDSNELKKLVAESGNQILKEHAMPKVDYVLPLMHKDDYLSIVTRLMEETSNARIALKSRETEYDVLQNIRDGEKTARSETAKTTKETQEKMFNMLYMSHAVKNPTEAEEHGMVAIEVDTSTYASTANKIGLSKLLGGDGNVDAEADTTHLNVYKTKIMLMKVRKPKSLYDNVERCPQIMNMIGVRRIILINESQMSAIRKKYENAYDFDRARDILRTHGFAIPSPAAELSDTSTVCRALEAMSQDDYLPVIHSFTETLNTLQESQSNINYGDSQKEMYAAPETSGKDMKRQKLEEAEIEPQSKRMKREMLSQKLQEGSDDLMDTDPIKRNCEVKLEKLSCHFTWNLEEYSDESFEIMSSLTEYIAHHSELSQVPHKAMKGYLYVSKFKSERERNSVYALELFNAAINDLKIDDTSDGKIGDKLVLLADKAWVYYLRRDFVTAFEIMKEIDDLPVSKKQQAYIAGHKGVSLAYFIKKGCDTGIDSFASALGEFPENTDWLFWQGFLLEIKRLRYFGKSQKLENTQLFNQIESLYKKILQLNPAHNFARVRLAGVLLERGQADDAKVSIDTSRKLSDSPSDLMLVAHHCTMNSNFEEAVKLLKEADKMLPNDSVIMHMLGNALRKRYKSTANDSQCLKGAIMHYDKALEYAGGQMPKASLGKAKTYAKMGDTKQATATYRHLTGNTLDPYWKSKACFEYASFIQKHGNDQEAFNYLKKAVEYDIQYWPVEKAARAIIKIMTEKADKNPRDQEAQRELGLIHNKLGSFERACTYLTKVAEKESSAE